MTHPLSESELAQRDASALMLAAGADDQEGMVRLVAGMQFERLANVAIFCARYATRQDEKLDGGSTPRRAAMSRAILDTELALSRESDTPDAG